MRNGREADNIVIQFRRTKNAQKSLFYEGIQIYNAMPSELKQCDRFTTFKRMLKEYITENWLVCKKNVLYRKLIAYVKRVLYQKLINM